MFSAITSFLGSAVFGGLTGLLGGIVNRVGDYFTLKENNKQKLAMLDKELDITKVEAEKELTLAREKNMTDREVAETQALEKSYEADKATYFTSDIQKELPEGAKTITAIAMAFVDFVRGLTRPGITLYMCLLTTLIYIQMQDIIAASGSKAFTPESAIKIIMIIIDGVIYLTTMAVGWWFASRAKQN